MASFLRTPAVKNAFRHINVTKRFTASATTMPSEQAPVTRTAFRTPPSNYSQANQPYAAAEAAGSSDNVLENFSSPEFSDEFVALMCQEPFPKEITDVLLAPISPSDVAAKPGFTGQEPVPYLPEIKYRRILNQAFGPGGWALVPRGVVTKNANVVSRDYALFARGRLIGQARGQQELNRGKGMEMALEGVKSNALMRCCKDLGIASELWDPTWVRNWKRQHAANSRNRQ